MFGDAGQPLRDLARRLGGDLRRVELVRVQPYQTKPLADFRAAKVFEIDAEALAVGKLRVVFALPGKVRVNLEAMANVADYEEGGQPSEAGKALA